MENNNENKPKGIFQQVMDAGANFMDTQITKARLDLEHARDNDAPDLEMNDPLYSKAIKTDNSLSRNSRGYKERGSENREMLRVISRKDNIIASIMATRKNQIAKFSKIAMSDEDEGFKIVLKDRDLEIEKEMLKIKIEMGMDDQEDRDRYRDLGEDADKVKVEKKDDADMEESLSGKDPVKVLQEEAAEVTEKFKAKGEEKKPEEEDEEKLLEDELKFMASKRVDRKFKSKKKEIEDFMLNCGSTEDRPFESAKWNFDLFLRSFIENSLTFDFAPIEKVRDQVGNLHHFFPVDGSTIRFAHPPSLKSAKDLSTVGSGIADITLPEKEEEYLKENTDALELDEKKLDDDEYKYVQVIRGQVARAFTEPEMSVGIRNPQTDIYANGYGLGEIELLFSIITSHLNAEYYNQAYFTQGFSAKGILHLKAPVNRRKLETIRLQWQHMLKGAKNSFQTPIFAGMDEVKWIPLTQNHSDIEFKGWLEYLIKVMCSVFSIDPSEIGHGMAESGGSGGGLSGDNTAEKITQSKQKGLYSLLNFVESFINSNIINGIDDNYRLVFCGATDSEDKNVKVDRYLKEVQNYKSVNEIRKEEGLEPFKGKEFDRPLHQSLQAALSTTRAADVEAEKAKREKEFENRVSEASEKKLEEYKDSAEGKALPDPIKMIGQKGMTEALYRDIDMKQTKSGEEDNSEESDVEKSLRKSEGNLISIEYYQIKE